MPTLYQIPNSPQYFITKEGEVWSAKRNKWLNSTIHRRYSRVVLCIDGKHKSHTIHRILATLFIPNPNNLPQVNHIDGNKLNNSISNLEWVTQSQNMQHASSNHLLGRKDKYTGIHFNNSRKKWCVRRLLADGTRKYLGAFDSKELAYSYLQSVIGRA